MIPAYLTQGSEDPLWKYQLNVPQRAYKRELTGFVEFIKEEDANKAIAEMHGKEFHGKELVVEKARPRKVNIWG